MSDTLAAALAAHAQGDFVTAKKLYEKILSVQPQAAAAWQGLAHIAYQKKDWQAAIQTLQTALTCELSQAERVQLLAYLGLSYQNAADLASAKHVFEKALALEPAHISIQYNLGTLLAQQEDWPAAIDIYERLLQQTPDFLPAIHNLAIAYCAVSAEEKALVLLQDAMPHWPDKLEQQFIETKILAGQKFLQENNLTAAKEIFLSILEQDTSLCLVPYNLGVIAYKEQDWRTALHYFSAVLQTNPQHFDSRYNLFLLHKQLGHLAEAKQHLTYLYQNYPQHETIQYLWAAVNHSTDYKTAPAAFVRNLFDHYAPHFDTDLTVLEYQLPSAIQQLLSEIQYPWPVAQAIDLGCGTGLCGIVLRPYVQYLIGVDISSEMLAVARNKQCYDELICDDVLQALNSRAGSVFNLMLAADVFGYIGDLAKLFSMINQHLAQQGLCIFSIELSENIDSSPGFYLTDSGRFTHSERYIKKLCQQYKLKIMSCQRCALRKQRGEPVVGQIFLVTKDNV